MTRIVARIPLALACLMFAVVQAYAQAPIVNPGAPGQPSRLIDAEEARTLAATTYTAADVRFLQDMIPHHHQALEMAWLVENRSTSSELVDLAGRIERSQNDEITFMKGWLNERGESVPDPTAAHAMHTTHKMAGMASPEQMAQLAKSEGEAFDTLFLELMIEHHKGALTMVEELLEQPGSAYDPVLYEFTNDITNDQEAEIERMTAMLAGFSPDPRVGLAAGYADAGEAISNLERIASLPKPPGFYNPDNPAGLPLARLKALAEDLIEGEDDAAKDDEDDERSPPLDFANTDMAFAGDVLVAGNYHGFNIYRLADDGIPSLISSVVCPGGQGDVSIVGDLLILSVEQTSARLDCGLGGVTETVSDERFMGLRIFDISNLERPRQVGAVQTCRGSHTHSVVQSDADRILVYNSGLRPVRDEQELAGCIADERYGDTRTALFRIDIIEIPVARPEQARVVASPTVFADPESGVIAGLWAGGDHGDDTQKTNQTNHCHDITVFPSLKLAAGACSGNGILFDISDPMNPQRIDEVVDPGFAYWHSATFNNDGSKVIFTDEWGGGMRPRCLASDPKHWGANAIYEIIDGQLEFAGYFKLPAPQSEQENCVAHNGGIVPVPGRDLFVQAWYQGGLSLIDFTDAAKPKEIAYFDRGPVDAEELVLGGYWSVYFYNGRIYGTEIARGLDVFRLLPSEHLDAADIAAAEGADVGGVFNPQQQFPVRWPTAAEAP
ncbi:MAG: DUF305 domain-containing protein [Wenzhouxiangellaceae bacterium]|nr:DUF305 domain-containing protein [Wenzhouxiangellaceae bacterium]